MVERRPARVWFPRPDHQDLGSRNRPVPGHARGPWPLGSLYRVVERRPARVWFRRPEPSRSGIPQLANVKPRSRAIATLFTLLRGRATAGSRLAPMTGPSRSGIPQPADARPRSRGIATLFTLLRGRATAGSRLVPKTEPSRSGIPQPTNAMPRSRAIASSVRSIAWSSDGRLASGSVDQTVKIWDLATGQCQVTLKIGYIHFFSSMCLQLTFYTRLPSTIDLESPITSTYTFNSASNPGYSPQPMGYGLNKRSDLDYIPRTESDEAPRGT